MGVYLGQLPPAEFARLKAEIAETIIGNFCYPRFFDNRTETLRMRPVDRAKRQEVWLYLSSFDFSSWGKVQILAPDFQHAIERLLIQFVQRNRSFFGEQGRKRMSDVRMLIATCGSLIAQGLRNHLNGTRPTNGQSPFGSPRPVASWASVAGKADLSWDQISSATMLLQQQVQEMRGEVKSVPQSQEAIAATAAKRSASSVLELERDEIPHVPTVVTPTPQSLGYAPQTPRRPSESQVAAQEQMPTPAFHKKSGSLSATSDAQVVVPRRPGAEIAADVPAQPGVRKSESLAARTPTDALAQTPARSFSAMGPSPQSVAQQANAQQRDVLAIGEDDLAIFEQMRHQLLVWLRVEAVRAGLETHGQSPAQLLDLLRVQARLDETRLQVVSTLLNLSNQVLKTRVVSLLDYKQALMFLLMHTKHVH